MSPSPYRWHPLSRPARLALGLPESIVQRAAGAPIEIDGRRLATATQAMLTIGNRLGMRGGEPANIEVSTARQEMRRITPIGMPTRRDVDTSERIIEVAQPDDTIRLRIYRPATSEPTRAIVYAHGGGWVVGDLDTHDGTCRVIAAESNTTVIAVDYRLAPEFRYPTPLADVITAYRWVHNNADELDLADTQISVMGDSAGGHLVACLALRALDRTQQIPLPHAQVLVYPAVDLTMTAPSTTSMGTGFGLTNDAMVWYRSAFLGDDISYDDPAVSPLFASSHAGLPPTYILTAGFDPLRDDGAAYAHALRDAGVSVRLRCFDDQIHGFFGMGVLPGGLERIESISRTVGRLVYDGG